MYDSRLSMVFWHFEPRQFLIYISIVLSLHFIEKQNKRVKTNKNDLHDPPMETITFLSSFFSYVTVFVPPIWSFSFHLHFHFTQNYYSSSSLYQNPSNFNLPHFRYLCINAISANGNQIERFLIFLSSSFLLLFTYNYSSLTFATKHRKWINFSKFTHNFFFSPFRFLSSPNRPAALK